ncbi:hypothetical protein B0H17DRAFT_1052508 [Mycena rosella]|uniref:SRR1-like domain-containing protein n=1 Tax=Mycena rosella TaxID=1033263 RepID=A0AAD7GIT0_MYCRO|nr:hypothetical protein B0H17DRAFT_1052508 [Mycena rosella]
MRRDVLVHPGNPLWRLRLHPTSRLSNRTCYIHGLECLDSSSLAIHHVDGSWTADECDAHPVWTHNLVDLCQSSADNLPGSHQCSNLCHMFQEDTPASYPTATPTLFDEIAYFHGSKYWDAHWDSESPPLFLLPPDLVNFINRNQAELVEKHLRQIMQYYTTMENAGFFAETASRFVQPVFRSSDPDRPRYPSSAFGAGFSGFDRIDERGWDRAGYEITADHSQDDWELRSSYQIAYFVALGRIFQIPAGHLVAYDPCYSVVDVVLLAALGVRALRKGDPGLKALRRFTNPTLFYAPGAEQSVFTDALLRADPIENLVILGGDAAWCGRWTATFTAHYRCIPVPAYVTAYNNEAPCGEENCLQWIPRSKVAAFNAARGPAREPAVRQMMMPDGSLEPDD